MLVRRERPGDVAAVHAVVAAAFSGAAHSAPPVAPGGPPGEVALLRWLREDSSWIESLSFVAVASTTDADEVVGHVVATRAHVGDLPVLGLGPVSVRPDRQGTGIGSALVLALLRAAEIEGEVLVGLLGDPAYYGRFGLVPATTLGVTPPDEGWGSAFQARGLRGYDGQTGRFRYADPFGWL